MNPAWRGPGDAPRVAEWLAALPARRPDGGPIDALWLLAPGESRHPAVQAVRADGRLAPAVRAVLADEWPLECRGLQRLEFDDARSVMSVGIGLARRDERGLVQRHEAGARRVRDEAIVVGAGLAGLSIAEALARRGWQVRLLERAGAPGGVVADVPLLAEHPAATATDDVRSRLLRAAMLVGRRVRGARSAASIACGRAVVSEPAALGRVLAHWPSELMTAAGIEPSDAVHARFAGARLLRTRRWITRVLEDPRIRLRCGSDVTAVQAVPGGWSVCDASGASIDRAPAMFLACQYDALALGGLLDAGTLAIGRMRMTPARVAIGDGGEAASCGRASIEGGERYRFELAGAHCVIGPCRDEAQLAIVQANEPDYRWRLAWPGTRLSFDDSLPMIGPVPDVGAVLARRAHHARNDRLPWPRRDGLYLATGLGGRGVLWSMLAGEHLASMAAGEPPLLEASLAAAVDPARLLRRAIRRGAAHLA